MRNNVYGFIIIFKYIDSVWLEIRTTEQMGFGILKCACIILFFFFFQTDFVLFKSGISLLIYCGKMT